MWKIPPETTRHSRTWMAWPWDGNIWNRIPGTSLKCCQSAFDRLVRTILNYENVSLLARDMDAAELTTLSEAGIFGALFLLYFFYLFFFFSHFFLIFFSFSSHFLYSFSFILYLCFFLVVAFLSFFLLK